MSDTELVETGGSVGQILRGLREAAKLLLPRSNILRAGYERLIAPRQVPHPVASVLFVCKGNVCRSPLADVYFQDKVRQGNLGIVVKSAGIETTPGKPAHSLARDVSREHGISLERHGTTPLFMDLVTQTDLVFVMEVSQKDRVLKLYPQARGKVFVLGQFCRSGALDIDDPYCGTREDFVQCFTRIREACDQVVSQIMDRRKTEAGAPK